MNGKFVLVAAAILAATATATTVLLAGHRNQEPTPADKPTPVASRPAPAGQAQEAAGVLSQLAGDPKSLVAAGAKSTVGGRAAQAIPAGSKISADVKSWASDGIGGGTMIVTVTPPGKPAASYAAVMAKEDGAWKVLATFPLATTAVATPTPS